MPLQTLPGIYLLALRVGELPEKDEEQVDEGPDAESAEREKLKNCSAGLAGVKAVCSEDAEQEAKHQQQAAVLRALARNLRLHRRTILNHARQDRNPRGTRAGEDLHWRARGHR